MHGGDGVKPGSRDHGRGSVVVPGSGSAGPVRMTPSYRTRQRNGPGTYMDQSA